MDVVDWLKTSGFEELYRVHEWHLAVGDWSTHAPPAGRGGVTVTTLQEEMSLRIDYVGQLHTFWNAPGRHPSADQVFAREEVEARLRSPHVVPESYFIARREGESPAH
jgi:hypothetical protein